MANRYIIDDATYCGDGTTSAEAASAGAAGAWNSITIFTGTTPPYGTLAAGDIVNIRALTSSGGTVAVSSSDAIDLGSTAATDLLPITWNFDNGLIWSGISGTVTITSTSTNAISVRNYNNIFSVNGSLSIISAYASFGNSKAVNFGLCNTSGVLVDISAHTLLYGGSVGFATGTHTNIHVKKKNSYDGLMCTVGGHTSAVALVNPKLELLGATNGVLGPLFYADGNYQGSFIVFGGECFGAGCVDGQAIAYSYGNASSISLVGFKYPRNMPLCLTSGNNKYVVSVSGDGAVGGAYFDSYYTSDSRSDGYYPTLNALTETSGSVGWSYKLYPYAVTQQKPARVVLSKLFTQAAASKTLTVSFLWPSGMSDPTKNKVYIVAGYTDNATGNKVYLSSKTAAADSITSSTASWSATTYGAVSFTRYELTLATTSAIKQDTEISLSFLAGVRSGTSNDIIFVDPDFLLT